MSNQDNQKQNVPSEEKRYTLLGRSVKQSDLFKLGGLVAVFVIVAGVFMALWPSFSDLFEPGGVDRVIGQIQDAGAMGVLILLGLQFLQIVVAFIPGEVTQVAAGMIYGPWFGALVILVGCVVSSSVVYMLVHKLGAPFVHAMVKDEHLHKFKEFERSGKLNIVVFILFLIPGMPKDVFTYLVPLTDMRLRTFLFLTTIGRIPGVLVTTFAAAGLADGNYTTSIIIFVIAGAIALAGVLGSNKIMNMLGGGQKLDEDIDDGRGSFDAESQREKDVSAER